VGNGSGSQNMSKSSASTYPPATAGGTDPIQARHLTFEASPNQISEIKTFEKSGCRLAYSEDQNEAMQ